MNKAKKKHRKQLGSVRQLPSGRWQASVKHKGEVIRAQGTFLYEHEAYAWCAVVKSELLSGITPKESSKPGAHMSFQSFFHDVYVATRTYRGSPLKPGTNALHSKLFRNHLRGFGDVPIRDIDYPAIMKWYRGLVDSGHLTTASKAYKLMKSVLRVAVEQGLIPENPCRVEGAGTASTGVKQYQPTTEDVVALAEAINPRYKHFVLFGAYSGLRFGELAALTRKDLAFSLDEFGIERWFVDVNKAVSIVNGKQVLGTPKSKKGIRKVPLGVAANAPVAEYLASMDNQSEDAVLFPGPSGGMLRHDAFMNRWNVGLKRIHLSGVGFTPHSLRRYAATQFANATGNLDELCDFLGDSTIKAAAGYIRSTNRAPKLADKVPNIFLDTPN